MSNDSSDKKENKGFLSKLGAVFKKSESEAPSSLASKIEKPLDPSLEPEKLEVKESAIEENPSSGLKPPLFVEADLAAELKPATFAIPEPITAIPASTVTSAEERPPQIQPPPFKNLVIPPVPKKEEPALDMVKVPSLFPSNKSVEVNIELAPPPIIPKFPKAITSEIIHSKELAAKSSEPARPTPLAASSMAAQISTIARPLAVAVPAPLTIKEQEQAAKGESPESINPVVLPEPIGQSLGVRAANLPPVFPLPLPAPLIKAENETTEFHIPLIQPPLRNKEILVEVPLAKDSENLTRSLSLFAPSTSNEPLGKQSITKVELDPNRRRREPQTPPPAPALGTEATSLVQETPPLVIAPKPDFAYRAAAGWVVGAIFLFGLGVAIYLFSRETVVNVNFALDELSVMETPLIVYNFDGQVSQIKRDYDERRKPMVLRLDAVERDLASAKADLAGREEKRRILMEEVQKLKDSIPVMVAESEAKLNNLWTNEGGDLDRSYESRKEELHQEIEKRAQELGLKYTRNTELDALEVAVNAFRLSLYGAPKGVNVDEQRIFSEDLLKRWRDFEKEWAVKQLEIKDEALVIKQSPGPKIDRAQAALENLKVNLNSLNIDLASLQDEVNRRQEEEVEEQEKLREAEKPFLSDLLKVPQNNILKSLSLGADGKIVLRKLNKTADMSPGDYRLFVQAQNQEEIFWAIKEFTVSKYKTTEVSIVREDFAPIRKFIQ